MSDVERAFGVGQSNESVERNGQLNEMEQRLVFERQIEIFQRIMQWRLENEQFGLAPDLTDTWTPVQRQRFQQDWQDDKIILQPVHGQKRTYEEMAADDKGLPITQVGRGHKRSHEEIDEDDDSDGIPFIVESVKQVNVKKFRTTGINYRIQFTNAFADVELSSFHNQLHEIFQRILDETTRGVPPNDQVRFVLHSQQLEQPISFPFLPRHRLTTERVLAEFQRVIQSNQEFRLNDTVDVNVIHVVMPQGGRGSKRSEINLEKHLAKKRSIVRIQNSDDLCLARALVVAKAKIDNDPQYKYIADHRKPMQTRFAEELHQKSGVPLGPCGLDEVKRFQTYLSEYQINVVSKEYMNSIIYTGPEQEKRIYLYMHNNHYDVITKMPGFFARKRYCHTCKKAYDHHEEHLCPNLCKCCRFPDCPVVSWVYCNDCKRLFKSQLCFDRHKQSVGDTLSICESLVKCTQCDKVFKRYKGKPENHHCGLRKCSTCGKYVRPQDHLCYMQPEEKKKKTKTTSTHEDEGIPQSGYDVSAFFDTECRQGEREPSEDEGEEETLRELLFFDFECRQENGTHEPNLCIVQNEAGDEWVFQGDKTRNDFCEWLFTDEHVNCTVMAHNFQGYDSYFILQYLRDNGVKYDVIMRGAKVLSLSVQMFNIRFIDSLNFIPMKLANFPKTFGMEELVKGYFPHLFNKKENETYIGPIPPIPYYNPNGMNPSDREKFFEWHNGMRDNNYVFNFQEEIVAYCRSDVDILRRCCLEFHELFHDITEIDPFANLTIASACSTVYRTNYLEKDTIAIIPPHGYRPENKQSLFAQKWLSYTAEKTEIYIQHARNGGEKRVGPYLLDGYHEETHTAYEVHGCFWHGCPKCYARDTVSPVSGKSMHELHQLTMERADFLKRQGYHVIEVWECDIRRQLTVDEGMKYYFDHYAVADPLEPRDALYGGRTNASKLYHECQQDEKIRYSDFTSLYPHVNRCKALPIGHPRIITENFDEDISNYFELIKCTVLPPRGLFHPVLPYRTQGKLMFALCKTCADTCNQTPCTHTDHERAIQGTWCSVELVKALEKGYRILQMHEV